jgi:membrane-bound lytic murein transglycosylase D
MAWILAALGAARIGSIPAVAGEFTQAPKTAQASSETGLSRLKVLVEAAEKAVEAEDWDAASDRADEAESLIADWSPEVLRRADVTPLLERLRLVLLQFQDEPGEAGEGLKMTEEVVALSENELKAERAQVLAAEQGAVFDFPIDLNDKVLTWVNIFTGRLKGKIEASLSRGSRYLPMIRQVFAEEGIPQDLAFLPIVESGYINHARSRAKAVGMWQFMRATGRIYGLNGNAWLEERRDPVKATRAAARYLKRLYEREGDWYLALVGYNAGPLTTDRASQNLETRNFWDMARSRWLRDATKSYVPQMCAAVLVGRFPERYGLRVTQETPYVYETVEVDKMTSLTVLAKHAGTGLEALKDLNPELLRATTPPGRYVLRVPPGTGGLTARALAKIPSRERLDFKPYVIRKGDVLAKVAARFNVSADDLLAANGLSKAQFKAGKHIQVPPPSTMAIDAQDLKPLGRPKNLADQPLEPLPPIGGGVPGTANGTKPAAEPVKVAVEPPPVPVPSPETVSAASAPVAPASAPSSGEGVRPKVHLVKRGETLFSIGERYGIDLKDLRKWNKIKGNRIQAGQRLRLQKP